MTYVKEPAAAVADDDVFDLLCRSGHTMTGSQTNRIQLALLTRDQAMRMLKVADEPVGITWPCRRAGGLALDHDHGLFGGATHQRGFPGQQHLAEADSGLGLITQ